MELQKSYHFSQISQNLVITETSLNWFEPVSGQKSELTDIFSIPKMIWSRNTGHFFQYFTN